jgi:methionine synthase II (cobalamin-independent)
VFATLLGAYPAASDMSSLEAAIREVIAELTAAGLEPLSDGQGAREARASDDALAIVDAWRLAASTTDRAVKQALVGPYTLARRAVGAKAADRASPAAPADVAGPIRETITALAAAGCPMIEIEEPAAVEIRGDEHERERFVEGLRAATAGLGEAIHLSLVLTGGNVDSLGAATLFDLPFSSYAFDLIAGPDNWRLIAQAPGDRGIVVGALDPSPLGSERPEVLVWAAQYAASTGGRGLVRVGLANASGLDGLTRERARAKVRALGEAARIAATTSPAELAAVLDPRAIDIRSAAAGRYIPAAGKRVRPG